MSAKENRALVRRWFEEANKGKAAVMTIIDELCSNNIVYHSAQKIKKSLKVPEIG